MSREMNNSANRAQNCACTSSAEVQPIEKRELKDSGIPWIGEIPKEWKVMKLRNLGKFSASGIDKKVVEDEPLVRIINYVDIYKNTNKELWEQNYMVVSAPAEKCQEHQVNVGDMFFTPSSETIEDIGVSAVVMEELANTAFSYHIIRFQPTTDIDFNFRKYITNNTACLNYFSSCATGSIRKTISRDVFKECIVPLPPLAEQQKIAEFLDRKCSEIDEIVALQEKVIEELKAYKQSVITEVVTKGLNPNTPMRDSGIEWIGSIPEHWEVARLKFYASIDSGDAISNEQIDRDEKYPVFGGGEIMGYYSQYNTGEDKLIIGRVGARCGCVTMPKQKCWASDNALVLKSCLPLKYTYHLLQAINLNRLNTSNAQPLITATKVKNVFIPLTPPTEQQAIADYLDEKCADIDSLIQTKLSKINSLKEYKKSIIYEYVTGKREVNE